MSKIEWCVYYADETTFDSNNGEPHEAPTEGFLCAVGYNESGQRYIMHGWDFYCWDKEASQWWGCDQFGLHDRLRRNVLYAYKEGRTVTNDMYQRIMRAAHIDTNFPQS